MKMMPRASCLSCRIPGLVCKKKLAIGTRNFPMQTLVRNVGQPDPMCLGSCHNYISIWADLPPVMCPKAKPSPLYRMVSCVYCYEMLLTNMGTSKAHEDVVMKRCPGTLRHLCVVPCIRPANRRIPEQKQSCFRCGK